MSDSISFRYYPSSNRVPGVYAEVDPSNANTGQINQRALIIAQKLAIGTAAPGIPYLYSSKSDAAVAFGDGSQMAIMCARYRAIDGFGELWCLPLSDDPAGIPATGAVTITGTATGVGVNSLYVGGELVSAAAALGDTPTMQATALAAALVLKPNLPVRATATAGVVTLVAANKGLAGNDIDLRMNSQGAPWESSPPGVTVAITKMAAGATNPTAALITAMANIAGIYPFDFIGSAFNDPITASTLALYLSDASGTWSWLEETFGHCFMGYAGTLSASGTFGNGHNDQHTTFIAASNSPSPSWYWAADLTAACAVSIRADPAVPLQDMALNVVAPPIPDRWDIGERNTLLYDGISTFKVDPSGRVYTDRIITSYQVSSTGAPDDSYLDVETMATLTFVIRDFRTELLTKFKRKKLVADGSRIPPGSSMTTAQLVAMAVVARYATLAVAGYVQNPAAFAKAAIGQNAGRGVVKLLLPIQLANQLRVVAMLVDFTKP